MDNSADSKSYSFCLRNRHSQPSLVAVALHLDGTTHLGLGRNETSCPPDPSAAYDTQVMGLGNGAPSEPSLVF